MARSKPSTRRSAKRNPCGELQLTRGGYGFVTTPEGEFFIPASKMHGAFDGDIVEIVPVSVNKDHRQPHKRHHAVGEKPTARVVSVVKRAHEVIIGRYEIAEPFGVVVPENDRIHHDIFTMHADNPQLQTGDIVEVRILTYPAPKQAATGVIRRVIGHADSPNVKIDAIIASHNLETRFSDEALAQAEAVTVDAAAALASGYRDIRDRFVWTIDPADARDFDDALSLERVGENWRLGVHIADVSHYVRPDDPCDRDARRRSTSVYLADRVIPMLPHDISDDVCSLAPEKDRRSMTVDITLSGDAQVLACDYYPALIRSDKRLTYEEAQDILNAPHNEEDMLSDRIHQIHVLTRKLLQLREKAGSLNLESREARVRLDDEGRPVGVDIRTRTDATTLVEQAMILANSCVAGYLERRGIPCIYRTHDAPSPDALIPLKPLLQEFGYDRLVDLDAFCAGNPRCLQTVLEHAHEEGRGAIMSYLLLRCMKRAVYSTDCKPHYGLALEHYCHFTSPIRRYPDLVVHRMLKQATHFTDDRIPTDGFATMAEQASAMERVAAAAESESRTLKLVEYLADFVGEIFPAQICKVTSYGFFVELENTAVGLVTLSGSFDEPFGFDYARQLLMGRDSGAVFRLGQRVSVRLRAADPDSRHLDFDVVGGER